MDSTREIDPAGARRGKAGSDVPAERRANPGERVSAAAPEPYASPRPDRDGEGGSLRLPGQPSDNAAPILIVDDEQAGRILLAEMLGTGGFSDVDTEADPRRVVERYLERRYSAVLLDLNMPGRHGLDVLEDLVEIEADGFAPVIVLTADTRPDIRLRALNRGARDFLTKPYDRLEVLYRLRNLVEMRRLHDEITAHNATLEARVRTRTHELAETRLQAVQSLGKAAEYRDHETGQHVVRMSHSSMVLARAVGLSEGYCELILHASPMHDIGKIGIPDRILRKRGTLDPAEFELMRTHTLIGEEILKVYDSELFRIGAEIARSHHERWDGTGYPDGAAGEAIPLSARIVTIADVFDALVSERPYKAAWPVDEAMRFLTAGAGRQFDPDLVRTFERCLPEVLESYPSGGDFRNG